MSTRFYSPEAVAVFLTKFGERLAPEFVRLYAGQKVGDMNARIARSLDLAIYNASDGAINLKSLGLDASLSSFFNPTVQGNGGGGTTEDPRTAVPVSQALAPGQAPTTAPYKALDIKKATPEAITEHADKLHVELQQAADGLRFNKVTPDRVDAMASKVTNAQHFYDAVNVRAESSGDLAEVQALFSHRFRKLASDLPAYQNQVELAQITLDRK